MASILFIMRGYITDTQRADFNAIMIQACKLAQSDISDVMSGKRDQRFVDIRQSVIIAMLNRGWNVSEIARAFSRDHTTIIHARNNYRKVTESMAKRGEKRASDVVELVDILTHAQIIRQPSKFERILFAKRMQAQGCGLYSIVGITNQNQIQ